jgi:hypothetical protein
MQGPIFKPACYSKYQTVEKILQALVKAPKQVAGSREAIEGKVFEVVQAGTNGPVGTLSELYEVLGLEEVMINAQNGPVLVVRYTDGTWKAIR